jgi:transcriptional regulator with XRE-family HTH domain
MSENTFAQQVSQRRKEMRLSLREIARLSGIAASTVSRIENGRLSPTLDYAAKLATVLNLEPPIPSSVAVLDRANAAPAPEAQELLGEVVVYRKIGSTILHGGVRRNLSRIAAQNGYQTAVLIRGTFQLLTNDGFKESLRHGATINCKIIAKGTYFGVAAQEAELLWVG